MESHKSSLIAVRFPALASRDYVLFVSGQLVSVIGTWMQATALPYLAYRMTGASRELFPGLRTQPQHCPGGRDGRRELA